jgi:hypothetical protein
MREERACAGARDGEAITSAINAPPNMNAVATWLVMERAD